MGRIKMQFDRKLTGAMKDTPNEDIIQSSLDFVREHLGMEVAYLSEFVGENLVFRRISAPGLEEAVKVGDAIPLDQVYCPHILEGRLPELMPDTALEPFAQTIELTKAFPIGAHVSIPIKRADGSNYGMFCCLSKDARPNLNQRDHDVMSAFARLSGETINGKLLQSDERDRIEKVISHAMTNRKFSMVFQPICASSNTMAMGFEALSRFESDPYRSPDKWFLDAAKIGLQVDLEICVIKEALESLSAFPAQIYVSVNASPATVQSGRLREAFSGHDMNRIVLELTEHEEISDYSALMEEIEFLKRRGVRIAIDDAGAGHAGLQQIVRLKPDVIKLDMSLTSDIDRDVVKRSLAAAILQFGRETRALIVAEGVETQAELDTLTKMGVDLLQGYYLGRPMPLDDALAFLS